MNTRNVCLTIHSMLILACLWFAGAAHANDMGYMPYMFLGLALICILESFRLIYTWEN